MTSSATDSVEIPDENGIFDDEGFGFNEVFDKFDLSDDDCYGQVGDDSVDLDSLKIRLNILGYSDDMSDNDLMFNIVHYINYIDTKLESHEYARVPEYSRIPFDPKKDEMNKDRMALMKKLFKTSLFISRVCRKRPEFVPLVVDNIHDVDGFRLGGLKNEIIENYLKNNIPD